MLLHRTAAVDKDAGAFLARSLVTPPHIRRRLIMGIGRFVAPKTLEVHLNRQVDAAPRSALWRPRR